MVRTIVVVITNSQLRARGKKPVEHVFLIYVGLIYKIPQELVPQNPGFEPHRDLGTASFLPVSVFSLANRECQPCHPAGSKGREEGTPDRLWRPAPRVGSQGAGARGSRKTACSLQALVGRPPKHLTLPTFLPTVGHGCNPPLGLRRSSGSSDVGVFRP